MTCSTERGRFQRGVALAIVLGMMVVMLLLGVTVGGLSTSNARMVMTAQDKVRARQAAWAGQAAAQTLLGSHLASATLPGSSGDLASATIPTQEAALPDPGGDRRACAYYKMEVVPAGGPAASKGITIRTTGYLMNDDGSRRAATAVTVRYHRDGGAFRYGIQASGLVKLEGDSRVTAVDGVAIRTDLSTFQRGGKTKVQGDILLGPFGSPLALTSDGSSEVAVAPAPAAIALQPVVPPPLESPIRASDEGLWANCGECGAEWQIDASFKNLTVRFKGTSFQIHGLVSEMGMQALLGQNVTSTGSDGHKFSWGDASPEARKAATNVRDPNLCPFIEEWLDAQGRVYIKDYNERRNETTSPTDPATSPNSPNSPNSHGNSGSYTGAGAGNSLTLWPGKYTFTGTDKLPGAKELTFATGFKGTAAVFLFDDMLKLEGCTLHLPPGLTVIYVNGPLDLKGLKVVPAELPTPQNPVPLPSHLLFLGTSECKQVLLEGCDPSTPPLLEDLPVGIYAPSANVTIADTILRGSVVGKTVTCTGSTTVTYDSVLNVLRYEGLGVASPRWVRED